MRVILGLLPTRIYLRVGEDAKHRIYRDFRGPTRLNTRVRSNI